MIHTVHCKCPVMFTGLEKFCVPNWLLRGNGCKESFMAERELNGNGHSSELSIMYDHQIFKISLVLKKFSNSCEY